MRLTSAQVAKAVTYNAQKAQEVGWLRSHAQVFSVLGFEWMCPGPEAFAQALADWQDAHKPLTVDGKLGPNTWGALEPYTRFSMAGGAPPSWLNPATPSTPSIPSTPPPSTGSGPPWLQIAQAQQARWDGAMTGWSNSKKGNAEQYFDWDEAYFAAAPYWGNKIHAPGETPAAGKNLNWCAAFVNFCLHSAGYSHTGSGGAGSFIGSSRWRFQALKEPRKGCVIVVGNAGPAHVAFLWGFYGLPKNPGGDVEVEEGMSVRSLGGNQSNRIKVKHEHRKLLAARGSNGVTSPYLWPEVGSANCNIPLPSAGPHYCRYQV